MRISIDSTRTGRALVIAVIAFNLLAFGVTGIVDVLGRDGGELARQLNVLQEGNVTAWFSATLLLAAAVLLAAVAWAARSRGDRDAVWWWVLAGGFVYLSLDEGAALHETLIGPIGELTDASGFFRYAWIIVAIPVVVILFFVFLGFLRRLPPVTRRWCLISGAVFLSGAIGVEAIGGAVEDVLTFHGAHRIFVSLEELLENLGAALFIATLLRHIARSEAKEAAFATVEVT
jgi:hypothetical protein